MSKLFGSCFFSVQKWMLFVTTFIAYHSSIKRQANHFRYSNSVYVWRMWVRLIRWDHLLNMTEGLHVISFVSFPASIRVFFWKQVTGIIFKFCFKVNFWASMKTKKDAILSLAVNQNTFSPDSSSLLFLIVTSSMTVLLPTVEAINLLYEQSHWTSNWETWATK